MECLLRYFIAGHSQNNGGGRIEEQSLAKAMDSLESVLKKVADAQVQYEIWVNP